LSRVKGGAHCVGRAKNASALWSFEVAPFHLRRLERVAQHAKVIRIEEIHNPVRRVVVIPNVYTRGAHDDS
jgi:hypothetical protein